MGRIMSAAALAAALSLPAAGTAAERKMSGTYDLFLGGLHAMEVEVAGAVGLTGYSMSAKIRTMGMVRRFYDTSIEALSSGQVLVGGLVPLRFSAKTRRPDEDQRVEMTWAGGAPAVVAEPEFDPKPWQIDPAEQTGTADPLTAVLSALAPAPADELCGRTVEVFDGRRRYEIELDAAAEPDGGGEIACPATYRRIAGFKPKQMGDNAEWPFRVFFSEREDGLWQMRRATAELPLGAAVLVLRE